MVSESNSEPSHAWEGGTTSLTCPWHFPLAADSTQPSAIPEASNPASDLASDALEAIVTVTETLEELQLPQEAVESESRGAIYSIPIMDDGGGGSSTPEDPAEAPRTLLGNSHPLPWGCLHLGEARGGRGQSQVEAGVVAAVTLPCPLSAAQWCRHIFCLSPNL